MKVSVILCVTVACFGCAEQSAPPKMAPAAEREPGAPGGRRHAG
jgi:hypothetical protein